MVTRKRLGFLLLSAIASCVMQGQRVDSNLVYGMYSGLALLMDVHFPPQPNGYGILLVPGSGFAAPLAFDAPELKQNIQVELYAKPLVQAGFTVFLINHRATPRFRYPAAVEDAQRAARFVRHHAKRFGIRPDRIGGMGSSSGGYLVSMLATMDGAGDPSDPDPVQRQSAKLQCIVAFQTAYDLLHPTAGGPATVSFMGMYLNTGPSRAPATSAEHRAFRDASPLHLLTKDDAPFLLVHGDADTIVPIIQSEMMEQALRKAEIPSKFLRLAGAGHGPRFSGAKNPPDYIGEMVRWFEAHLKIQ